MGKVRQIGPVSELTVQNYTFTAGHFFGINNEARFYCIKRIERDGGLTLDVYSIDNNEARMTHKDCSGYTIDGFKYRNQQKDLWTDSVPPVAIVDQTVKKEEKTYFHEKRTKSSKSTVSEKQGKFF